MELSIVVARILSLVYLSAGTAALSGQIRFGKMVEDFEKSQGLTFVTGFFTIVCGVILVSYHNVWVKGWPVLVTVIGWMALLKGILLTAFPRVISNFKNSYKNTRVWGVLMLALGLVFGCFGFLA